MAKKGNSNYMNMSEEDRQSELLMLKNSWDMYERTKAETENRRNTARNKNGDKIYSEKSTKKTMELLNTMQEDIKNKYLALGGTMEELTAKKRGRTKKATNDRMAMFKAILEKEKKMAMQGISDDVVDNIPIETEKTHQEASNKPTESVDYSFYSDENENGYKSMEEQNNDDMQGILANSINPVHPIVENDPPIDDIHCTEEQVTNTYDEDKISVDVSKVKGQNIKYDVIPLPSKGQCYKNKMKKIPVAYLTAYDENMIVAPNMYKDGMFLDYMLEAKIMTDEIKPSELLPGDRDAIILWLRASGYGNEFPVNATDNATGKQFESVVDLTKLKYKKFDLKGDANGYFDFTLPLTKDKIKFKFLTHGDIKALEKMEEDEVISIRKGKVYDIADNLADILDEDREMDSEIRVKIADAEKSVRRYADTIQGEDDTMLYSHSVTNRLAASIMSINGVSNRDYIEEYVRFMNVRDSSALRKYIVENEPGIDFNIEVERPQSLGGGSVRMFLTIDQFIFLSVA